jgi:hypothetical protein
MFLSLGSACCYVSWNFRQTAVAVAKSQDGGWLMKPDKVQSSPSNIYSMCCILIVLFIQIACN